MKLKLILEAILMFKKFTNETLIFNGPVLLDQSGQLLAIREKDRFVISLGQNQEVPEEVEEFLVKFHPGKIGNHFPVDFFSRDFFQPREIINQS